LPTAALPELVLPPRLSNVHPTYVLPFTGSSLASVPSVTWRAYSMVLSIAGTKLLPRFHHRFAKCHGTRSVTLL
jgi:hypothetical protein